MAHSWVSIVGWFLILSVCAFAWLKGGMAERVGATWVLAMYVASDVVIGLSFPHIPQTALFALDFATAVGLLGVTIRYSSLWLGLAMLLQSFALFEHALVLEGAGLRPIQWMILNDAISLLMLICIVIATALSWRARGRPAATSAYILVGDAPAH